MNASILVENLWKEYLIGGAEPAHTTLRDSITESFSGIARRLKRLQGKADEDAFFWALKDINIAIEAGEIIGVIGRNGAGKSTLLKLLSRITAPTQGKIQYRGRLSSLLEVGTGFHPELSGRENIYMNGAILGMKRESIRKKLEEIVEFAEIKTFLDTPVKRYSSGMYVRLAFAVAAHLDADILLVDEVLAVGDSIFQKKCLNKLESFSQSESTVIFVSHNMDAITSLCTRGIYIHGGEIAFDGPIDAAVSEYMNHSIFQKGAVKAADHRGPTKKEVLFESIYINGEKVSKKPLLDPRHPVLFEVQGKSVRSIGNFDIHLVITQSGKRILTLHDSPPETRLPAGRFVSKFILPENLLRPGEYALTLAGARYGMSEWVEVIDACTFEVLAKWSNKYCQRADGIINVVGYGSRVKPVEN